MGRSVLFARKHGERQLELELVYPLARSGARETPGNGRAAEEAYALDVFFFTPYQLGVTKARFAVETFFGDLVSYTRYRTPQMELERIVDPRCEASPVNRIRRSLAERDPGLGVDETTISLELRTIVNIYRSQTRDRRHAIRDGLQAGRLTTEEVEGHARRLLEDMRAVCDSVRSLAPLFLNAGIPEGVRDGYRRTDEILSIRSEKNFFRLYRDIEEVPGLEGLRDELRQRTKDEESGRRGRGYGTWVDPEDPRRNERFIYHDGALKKWSESCMYMTVSPSRTLSRVLQVLFAVAAAIAMAFAVFASILAARWFPEGSTTWALVAVLAYAFKDRIKDGLRAAFLRALPRLVADRVQHLAVPKTGVRVGRSRERVSFPIAREVPADVIRLRYGQPDPLRAVSPPEDVLHYHKDIRIDSRPVVEAEPRTDALVEILRLDLREWCARMDEPEDRLQWFDEEVLRKLSADRVYHVSAVVRLTSAHDPPGGPATLFRYRLVLTRRGLLRVELASG